MFRYQSGKRALFIAVMIVLLCFLCLTGATLAVFTNSQSDGTIGVITTAGNVKVDIVDALDTNRSLVGNVLQFESNANGERFDTDSVYFEPGAAFRTHGFKVKNKGDIPIKFRVYISEDENHDMTAFNEAFEILISDDPTDMSNAVSVIEFDEKLDPYACSDSTYYLYIKMKETADNDFQNFECSGIGVTVYAAQGNITVGD